MRVISGRLGGRLFDALTGNRTHPMAERVRGALFNALGDINNLSVLDAFAGSGALSFEAISRGAKSSVAVELDKNALRTIKSNIEKLGLGGQIKAIRANATSWSNNNPNSSFDLVLIDPPYDNLQLSLVQKLTKHLKSNGVLVLAWPGKLIAPELVGLKIISQKNYGDAQLIFYRSLL